MKQQKLVLLLRILKKFLNEIAILVRAIFQTREFEERFLKVEFHIELGGINFMKGQK